MFPFYALHVIHKLFAVAVVKQDSDFGCFIVLEVEPELLNFNCLIIHILSKILHGNLCLHWFIIQRWCTNNILSLRIDNFDNDEIIIILHFKLETLVENWIVFWLTLSGADIVNVEVTILVFTFDLNGDIRFNHPSWKISSFNNIQEALFLEEFVFCTSINLHILDMLQLFITLEHFVLAFKHALSQLPDNINIAI
jgi:hypothetical protein